jgi:hypothetical protein
MPKRATGRGDTRPIVAEPLLDYETPIINHKKRAQGTARFTVFVGVDSLELGPKKLLLARL